MKKQYKSVIFDLDGTLLNTRNMNLIPLKRLIKEVQGKEVEVEELFKYMAYPGLKTLELLGFENVNESYKTWVKYVNEHEEGATLYNGFDKVIKELDERGIACGIASSKLKKQYEIDFIPTGLHEYMKSIVLADDTQNHKPHPEPLLKAVELIGIEPKNSIYVGDTIADYKAAKEAGMDFALALWGAFDINEINADYELNEPMDLLSIID
ncbi:HAD family hydrolase [Clostridium carnis]